MWRLALPGLLLAALVLPAGAEDADPFAKIFNDMKARWSAAEKAAETADARVTQACETAQVPRMSFQPVTTYTDVTAAVADGAVPRDDTANAYRSGDLVLRLARETGASVLMLEDENAKPVVSRSMTQACAPVSITAAPDGGFLVQVQGDRVLWLDRGDLQTKAIYQLTMPPKLSASSITLLPDNRLVATTAATPPSQSPVLVYNLSAPSPQ
jgi:hypothetical protein